ncbi:hypothetical protein WA026_005658 [Henosepilachna vigintioctopunctata]|uniref:Serpin domain-containing protein n=1 Tax=Henosepilachna vigintioctopunctata TaxID=420089 RepID=A0AAW1TTI1_9CUCU
MMNWLDEQNIMLQNNIALLNGIYVSGRWLQGFDKRLTKEMDFHLSPSKTVKVNMMKVTGYFMVSRCPILGVKILKLPLENERAQMLVGLTDDTEGLDSVLAPNALKLWNERHFNKEFITLYMPRFELTSDMDLTPTLMKMGISKLFSAADLSGINDELTNVSLISQNIHLMVNERGISSINWPLMEDNIIEKQGNLSKKPTTVKLDHPFFFGILYDDMSLMFGRISNL